MTLPAVGVGAATDSANNRATGDSAALAVKFELENWSDDADEQ